MKCSCKLTNAPAGPGAGVNLLVGVGAWSAQARRRAARCVYAELEPTRVHIIGHELNTVVLAGCRGWEQHRVGDEDAVGSAVHRPAVVEIQKLEAHILEAVGHHRVCCLLEDLRVDVRVEVVPASVRARGPGVSVGGSAPGHQCQGAASAVASAAAGGVS
jgi:hypothetical protein